MFRFSFCKVRNDIYVRHLPIGMQILSLLTERSYFISMDSFKNLQCQVIHLKFSYYNWFQRKFLTIICQKYNLSIKNNMEFLLNGSYTWWINYSYIHFMMGKSQGWTLSMLLLNIVIQNPVNAIKIRKTEVNWNVLKTEDKLFLFEDNMIILKNWKNQ